MENTTSWQSALPQQAFPALDKNLDTDVVIVGGGMAGLLSAYVLAKAGKKVVVLEKGKLAQGATMQTTAFLTEIIDTAAEDVIRMLGLRKAKLLYTSHMAAIALIERIVREEQIDCDFTRTSNYILATTRNEADDLEDELDVLKALDVRATFARHLDIGVPHTGVVEIKDQAIFHPLEFIAGLIPALSRLGVAIYENSEVASLTTTDAVLAKVGDHAVRAKWSITTTFQPFDNPKNVFMKKATYTSYVYEIEVKKGTYTPGMYEDMKSPYHYFRVATSDVCDTIIVGGEDHRANIPMDNEKNWQALSDFCTKMFGNYTIVRRWEGPILEPVDGFALIGVIRPQQIIATAFSGNGMTYAGITALMAKDIIEKGSSDWSTIYNPKRFPTFTMLRIKARDYLSIFLHGALRNILKYHKQISKKVGTYLSRK